MDNDNVLPFGRQAQATSKGNISTETGDGFPENNYVVIDLDDEEFYGSGFLIFTPHHCAIMKDFGKGAVPTLVVPLHRVKVAEMVDESAEDVDVG
jgi:hypothetical protein